MTKLTKKQIYIIGGIILIIIFGYLIFGGSKKSSYEYVEVKRGEVMQEVSVTGKIKPVDDVDLAFQRTGKVSQINVKVGDLVTKNGILVRLDSSELSAQLAGAQAGLRIQEAKLDELKKGTRPEEIQIQETNVASAKTALDDTKKILINSLTDAFTKSDDAIRNKVDQFVNNPKSTNPTLNFTLADGQLKNDIEWGRYILEGILIDWNNFLNSLSVNSDLDAADSLANKNLDSVKNFLDKVSLAVNSLTSTANLSQTTITGYKTDIASARTNIGLAISSLSSAYESYRSAKSNLELQENQLVLEKAGTVAEQITAQEAQVEKMRADIDTYNAQIAQTVLRSPIDGVVTRQDAKIGEIVAANSVIASVISSGQYEIEVNVPEADIAKIAIGNSASITLDAYGSGVIFSAHVVSIDPAETVIEGVATYKTTLQFDKKEDMVKPGMTANIDILAQKKENVLFIPQRAVVSRGEERIVLIDTGKQTPEELRIETGLKGSDGNIEIVSGLNEGQKIINSPSL